MVGYCLCRVSVHVFHMSRHYTQTILSAIIVHLYLFSLYFHFTQNTVFMQETVKHVYI